MRVWVRELAGWLLVALGLYVFLACASGLLNPSADFLLEAGPLTLIGFVIFRGGIHLLKVATAARVCMAAQTELTRQQAGARPGRAEPSVPWDW
jgi:hypothetical protein